MSDEPIELVVEVDAGLEADEAELAELSLSLRDDLAELDVESVRFARGEPAPERSKSVDPTEWGTLLVTVVSSGTLRALIDTANGWASRRRGGTLRVRIGDDELLLTGVSSGHHDRVIEDWLARRAAVEGAGG